MVLVFRPEPVTQEAALLTARQPSASAPLALDTSTETFVTRSPWDTCQGLLIFAPQGAVQMHLGTRHLW